MTDSMYEILNRIDTLKKRFGLAKPAQKKQDETAEPGTVQFSPDIHQAAQSGKGTAPATEAMPAQKPDLSTLPGEKPDVSAIIKTVTADPSQKTSTDPLTSAISDKKNYMVQSALQQYRKSQNTNTETLPSVDTVK